MDEDQTTQAGSDQGRAKSPTAEELLSEEKRKTKRKILGGAARDLSIDSPDTQRPAIYAILTAAPLVTGLVTHLLLARSAMAATWPAGTYVVPAAATVSFALMAIMLVRGAGDR